MEDVSRIGYDGQIPPREMAVRDPDGEGKRTVTVQRRMDRLEWLLAHSKDTGIRQHHYEAGRRLQRDWEQSERLAIAQISGGAGGRAGLGNEVADSKIAAAQRFRDAIAMLDDEVRRVVEIMILENRGVPFVVKAVKLHRRAALPMLRSGLGTLAKHYGFV